MTIKAVIFDFGGVILMPLGAQHVEAWARRLGVPPEALREALWGEAWRALERDQIDEQTYHRRLTQALRLPDLEAVERFVRAFYADERLYPEMLKLVQRLRDNGHVKVALLTNAFAGFDRLMRRKWDLDPRQFFDVYINSADVRLAKPDAAIFQLALDRLGVSADEALFIDDNAANVEGAAELGIHTVHFASPELLGTVIRQVEELVG